MNKANDPAGWVAAIRADTSLDHAPGGLLWDSVTQNWLWPCVTIVSAV